MSAIAKLLPQQANNDYRGSKIALWAFWLFMAPSIFRAFVHFLTDDAGLNAIASIIVFTGTPDPNTVIYLFGSLWGGQQLLMVGVYLVVVLRYRNLLPLMWVIVVFEQLFRMTSGALHSLTPDYYAHTPPGKFATPITLGIGVLMLVLSLRTPRTSTPGDA